MIRLLQAGLLLIVLTKTAVAETDLRLGAKLSSEQVAGFANLALEGIPREYPNKPGNVMTGPESVRSPREMHPVFFGSFDWHSSVHGHWMLVRLAKLYPEAPVVPEIRQLLDKQLTAEKLAKEAEYFDITENRTFERMYGWAWLLRLVAELDTWEDADAKRWATNLRPLEGKIVSLTKDYLPRLTYPIRIGEHTDTAFALGQILDYARAANDKALAGQIEAFCREKYLQDADYPGSYEPSGHDFFSQSWNETDLMRRVLSPTEFADWLQQFLPGLATRDAKIQSLLTPAIVSDPSDPKLVHLAGLNLSRAWTQNGVASALPKDDPRKAILTACATAHLRAGLDYVFSGHYEGEHWLATFAVYALTEVGVKR
ncbi:MAG: DUF2891 domain-containing protein [Planctomycetota bacterium]